MSTPYAKLPAWADYGLIPLLNLIVAFLVAGLVVLLVGESPVRAAGILVKGAFGGGQNIAYTLYYATNFIFTGLAVAVAFHCGLFNIGGEGQAYVGGLGVALVCLAFDSTFPWWINFPLAIMGSALAGALWAFIPAWLQAKRGSHIVITTIMFNFIAASLMVYLLVGPLKPAASMAPQTRTFLEGGQLPKLGWLLESVGLAVRSAPLNVSFLLALAMAVLVWATIWRTKLGYEIRTMGFSAKAARYAGINRVADHHHHDDDLGSVGRHDVAQCDHGRSASHGDRLRDGSWLRRHRRRINGTIASGGHRARSHPVRDALSRWRRPVVRDAQHLA